MNKYILRRVTIAIPLILAIMTIVFVMLRLIPGDPALLLAGDRASPELIENIRASLGLNRPIWEQYLIFLRNAATGDMGISIIHRDSVTSLIFKAFPFTVAVTFYSVTIGTSIGLLVGIITAIKRGTWVDNLMMVLVVFFYSIPTFWLGIMLILIFAVGLRILPVQGADTWRHFVLPVATLSVGQAALIARLTRSSMIEILNADFIRTARSKGLTSRKIILVHALKNSLIPIITVVGLSVGGLLGGAVITESIFGLPGVGRLAIEAIGNRDYPMIQATVLLVAVTFVFVNLVVDLIYAFVDPRIHYG